MDAEGDRQLSNPPHMREPAGKPRSSNNFMNHFYNHSGYYRRPATMPVTNYHKTMHPSLQGQAPAGRSTRHPQDMDPPRRKAKYFEKTMFTMFIIDSNFQNIF